MPDGSLLVNIARGKVANTDALLAHAKSGRLRLALDVTDPEPLPEGHPLFRCQTCRSLLTSAAVDGAGSRGWRASSRTDRSLLRDEPPINVVLPARTSGGAP